MLSLALLAACGSNAGASEAGASARICYDNLGGNYVSEADTKVTIKGAKNLQGFDAEGNPVDKYSEIATYSNGVFTAKSAGSITYQVGGEYGRLEVVPAYATDPGNQYRSVLDATALNPGTYLGNTHDPSFIETNDEGFSTYFLFSTGWNTGNDIHYSSDMLTWNYLGKTHATTDFGNAEMFPQQLKDWMGAKNNSGDIQWWAPDIVKAPDGGYWLYTCTTMSDAITKAAYYASEDEKVTITHNYSRAAIVLYHIDSLELEYTGAGNNRRASLKDDFKYVGVLMQSAIPQDGSGNYCEIDINSIDPQIIYDTNGKMYMAYGSFGTGNWLLELNPQTGLRKDDVYADGNFKDLLTVRKERNKIVTGKEDDMGSKTPGENKYYKDFLAGTEVSSEFYGKLITLGAMEAPVLARHDGVKVADETATYGENGEPEGVDAKSYFYSMHSYNWLESAYQMWGGRSESVWGTYRSTQNGLVVNNAPGSNGNQGNKYMGAFKWRDESKSANNTEFDIVLPGHNDLYTAKNGSNLAAYITRTFDYQNSERFAVQIHQYYLNSMGDICINPNRYGGEIDRSVSKEELLHYTDDGKFEMVVLTNATDADIRSPGNNASLNAIKNVSFEVQLTEDGKIKRGATEIGSWLMYGKGYIKFEFNETLKGTGNYNSGEKVYYGVVRPAWLYNSNCSGFTISCMGHTEGNDKSMAMFMNSHSKIEFAK